MTKSRADSTGIAANIRAELARRDITQGQLAELLGLTTTPMSKRLRGQMPFRDHELVRIAEFLNISIAALFA
jgi:transcriptional regulator with XRE-family HTH domain